MYVSELINAAADHIAHNPVDYDFKHGGIDRRGAPMCMLARMGDIAGMAEGLGCETIARELLGASPEQFYSAICASMGLSWHSSFGNSIVYQASVVPAAMRAIASRYEGIPVVIRDIFKQQAVHTEAV
jgi:hypothetical protein